MTKGTGGARRVPYLSAKGERERGIYTRTNADGLTVFEIGWRDSAGKQRWRRVDGGITAARAALAAEHARRARGERTTTDPRLRFTDAADAWWEARVTKLRPTTQAAYASALGHVREQFGTWRLTEIAPADVSRYVTKQQRAGQRASTIRSQLVALGSVFKYAARDLGFIGSNPVSLLDKSERPHDDDEDRPRRVLSPAEVGRLVDSADDAYRLMFAVSADTGARIGEVLGLTWGAVDTKGASVHFFQQLDRHGALVRLKTKRSRRWVEISDDLAASLRAHRAASDASQAHDLVFRSQVGTPVDHANVRRAFARAVKAAELGAVVRDGTEVLPAPSVHDLRHAHASALIDQGWNPVEISSRLGHADTTVTLKVYVHEFDHAGRSDDRRSRLPRRPSGSTMEAADGSSAQQGAQAVTGNVRSLRA